MCNSLDDNNKEKENTWMRMSKLVSSLRKQTTTKPKENHQTITTATDCYCGMVLAQCVRMKPKKKQITSYPNIHTHTHTQNREWWMMSTKKLTHTHTHKEKRKVSPYRKREDIN